MDLLIFRRTKFLVLSLFLFMICATGGCKQGPWSLWESYSARFIDSQGRVIDPQGAGRTTSEAQAYAMFFALVDNDRNTFDRLLTWTQANMAKGDLQTHLPSWLWGKSPTGEWKALDANSASDADIWMAYTLIEAGRLWKDPVDANLGRQMLAAIARSEVAELPGFGTVLLPGPTGFQHDRIWTVNPSYLPLFVFKRLAQVDPAGPWGQIALGIPGLLRLSSRHGFVMDWVDYIPGDGFYPASPHPGVLKPDKQPEAPVGSYDAIRVYLWAGMLDAHDPARTDVLNAIQGMTGYLANHGAPPEKVSDQGVPLGQDGPVGFSAAVLPYLRTDPNLERVSAQQTIRLAAQKDSSSGLYGKDLTYYDQNLALFATGFLDGRFRFGSGGEVKVDWTHS